MAIPEEREDGRKTLISRNGAVSPRMGNPKRNDDCIIWRVPEEPEFLETAEFLHIVQGIGSIDPQKMSCVQEPVTFTARFSVDPQVAIICGAMTVSPQISIRFVFFFFFRFLWNNLLIVF